MTKRIVCPKCGSKDIASAPGGTHLYLTNSKIKYVCCNPDCVFEFGDTTSKEILEAVVAKTLQDGYLIW